MHKWNLTIRQEIEIKASKLELKKLNFSADNIILHVENTKDSIKTKPCWN